MGAFGLEITVVNRCFLVKGGWGGGGGIDRTDCEIILNVSFVE